MKKSFDHFLVVWSVIIGIFWTVPLPAAAIQPSEETPRQRFLIDPDTKRHFFTLAIGAVYWPNLADIDPSTAGYDPRQFGRFAEWGTTLRSPITTWQRPCWIATCESVSILDSSTMKTKGRLPPLCCFPGVSPPAKSAPGAST